MQRCGRVLGVLLTRLWMQECSKASIIVKRSATYSSTFVRRMSLKTQFDSIKKQYPDYVILFQVGDFYEIYGEDAGGAEFILLPSRVVGEMSE